MTTAGIAEKTRPAILLVGCGAIGGLVAAALSDVADLVVLDRDTAHVAAMRERGLRITGQQDRTVRVAVVSDPKAVAGRPFDAVLFLTKSKQTAPALAALGPDLVGRPLLVTTQNGMGNAEALLNGHDLSVARGVSMDAGRFVGPGVIEHLIRATKSWIGPVRGTVAEVAWLADLLTAGGMPTDAVEDPMPVVWSKLVFNAVMNPIGALLRGSNRARYASPEVCALIDEMAAECTRVVEGLGGRFTYDPLDYVKKVRAGTLPVTSHAGSMALDIARGGPTEIDELTGFLVREADRLGISVPACRTVWRLVKGLELAVAPTEKVSAP